MKEDVQRLIKHIQELIEQHWLMVLAIGVLVLSVWMYTITYSSILLPFVLLPMLYIMTVVFRINREHKQHKKMQKKAPPKPFTIMHVYTNDPDFETYMHDPQYLDQQEAYLEERRIDLSGDIAEQIPYVYEYGFDYCYHLIIDESGQMYLAGAYEQLDEERL